jgi:DNA-binding MarR family transcriptional regulator
MGRPQTVLEGLCAHALQFDVESFSVVHEGAFQRAWAEIDGVRSRILNFQYDSRDSKELRENLAAALKKPILCVIEGRRVIIRVRRFEEDVHEVTMEPAQPLDPSSTPKFTSKQGQYLAYIVAYVKIHRQAPAESDLQRYFRVSAPSVNGMIKTLERNGLIERTPGVGRSIRLLVRPEHLPHLE